MVLTALLTIGGCQIAPVTEEISEEPEIMQEAGLTEPETTQSFETTEPESGSPDTDDSGRGAGEAGTEEVAAETEPEETAEPEAEESTAVTDNEGKTPFEAHGRLSVVGTQLTDENGDPYQLVGVSSAGLAWYPEYVNEDAFRSLRDDWNANAIRLAMYTAENGGYCVGDDAHRQKMYDLVCKGIDAATDLGMYVIADWHILSDNDPTTYRSMAEDFFKKLSKKYKDNDNVIYELCNEPNGGTDWATIKAYAEDIIPIIRANDPDAIIIVGTPTWSQDVDKAAADPITDYDNIMYVLHFYADTHSFLRDRLKQAIKAGLPVFVSEYGICDASGNGRNNISEGNKWVDTMDEYGVSYMIWNLSNKNEAAALISSSCSKTSGWSYSDLSESGKWAYDMMNARRGVVHTADSNDYAQSSEASSSGSNSSGGSVVNEGASQSISGGGELSAAVSASNSWTGENGNYVQYGVNISNGTGSQIDSWTVKITFSTNIQLDQAWCCKTSVSGNTLTVTPESYNGSLASGASTGDVGLIVYASGSYTITSVEVN